MNSSVLLQPWAVLLLQILWCHPSVGNWIEKASPKRDFWESVSRSRKNLISSSFIPSERCFTFDPLYTSTSAALLQFNRSSSVVASIPAVRGPLFLSRTQSWEVFFLFLFYYSRTAVFPIKIDFLRVFFIGAEAGLVKLKPAPAGGGVLWGDNKILPKPVSLTSLMSGRTSNFSFSFLEWKNTKLPFPFSFLEWKKHFEKNLFVRRPSWIRENSNARIDDNPCL